MPMVFISHSSEDRQFVIHDLVPFLKLNGVETYAVALFSTKSGVGPLFLGV